MALPNSNISTTLVGNTIGSGSRDVGTLCTHPNVNKWSKWKPIRSDNVIGITDTEIIDNKCGLDRNPQTQEIYYKAPRGGSYSEPFRIGDFRSYNHLAKPPVNVEIVSVSGQETPPFELVQGRTYEIKFKLIPGEIDPLWIDLRTSRVKNTNESGGYGGIAWVTGNENMEHTKESSEVFSCEYLDPPVLSAPVYADGNTPIRVEYCRYEGSTTGKYKTTMLRIEDNGFWNSYRSMFTYRNLLASINQTSPFVLNKLMDEVSLRIGLINQETFSINSRIRIEYKHVQSGDNYTFNSGVFTLNANYDSIYFIQPIDGWTNGLNTYEFKVWLYLVQPDLSETELSYRAETASITISTET